MKTKSLLISILTLAAACSDASGPDQGGGGPAPVARVQVTAPAAELEAGASMQLEAAALDASGRPLAGRAVAWSSGDDAVATVSSAGRVTAHGAGTVTITAASEGRQGHATLTVRAAARPVTWVQVTPGGELVQLEGSSRQLGFTARAADGSEVEGRAAAWSSSAPGVASVSAAGLLEARGYGDAVVTVTVDGVQGTARVIVPTRIERVEMDRQALGLGVGEAAQLSARARGYDGAALDRAFLWTTSDPSVASVDATGRVTARGAGTATITAASEGKSGSVRVSVGTWSRMPLAAVGDSALPATMFRYTPAGAARPVHYRATEGVLRLLSGASRYELRVNGWYGADGDAAVQAEIGRQGSYLYDMFTGDILLETPGHPTLRGRVRPDGKLEVKWRHAPDAPVSTLVFDQP